jgi:hypothetical protein
MIQEVKSFFQPGADAIKELFLQNKAAEFASFAAGEEAKRRGAESFRTKTGQLAEEKDFHAALVHQCQFYQQAAIARSIYSNTRKGPRGVAGLEDMAATLSPAYLLSLFANDIAKLSAQRVSELEADLAAFKKENASLLKELGLF